MELTGLRPHGRSLDRRSRVRRRLLCGQPNPAVQDFVQRYKKRFQTSPTLFAVQGYDAAKLVIDAIRKGATSGEAVHDQLLTPAGPSIPTGPAAFGPDGTLNRPLFSSCKSNEADFSR